MKNRLACKAKAAFAAAMLPMLLLAPALAEGTDAAAPFDIAYLLVLQQFRADTGDVFTGLMKFFTLLGEAPVPLFLGALFFWVIDKRTGTYLFFSNGFGHVINQVMKVSFCAYRPWIRDARIIPVDGAKTTATGYSFPSGHVTNSGAALGTLSVYSREKVKGKGAKAAFGIGFGILWLLVGLSRNYLGVHTPQDVVVMLVLMSLIMYVVAKVLRMCEEHPERILPTAMIGMAMGLLLAVYAAVKHYPMDYTADGTLLVDPQKMAKDCFLSAGMLFGLSLAWLGETKWIHFDLNVKPFAKILRAVVGIAGMLLIYLGAGKPLSAVLGALWGSFFQTALLMLYGVLVHPLCFTCWEKNWARRSRKH